MSFEEALRRRMQQRDSEMETSRPDCCVTSLRGLSSSL